MMSAIRVEPEAGQVDEPVEFRVDPSHAGAEATLTVSTTDAAGNAWTSSGRYRVKPEGTLALPDRDRPWWDMAFTRWDTPPVAFTAPDDSLDYPGRDRGRRRDGATNRTPSVGRRARPHRVGGRRLAAARLPPGNRPRGEAGRRRGPGLDGRRRDGADGGTHGLARLHCRRPRLHGEQGLPASFREISVEALVRGMQAFREEEDVDTFGVLAVSVGTAAALCALSGDDAPEVSGVVAVAPTHVVWQALADGGRPPATSSLTRGGAPLPYVPLRGEKLLGQMLRGAVAARLSRRPRSRALAMRPAYAAGLRDENNVAAAAISVDRIAAPLLAVAGEADAMWPSADMARALIAARARPADGLLVLPEAGHFLRPPATPTNVDRTADLVSGGTPAGIARGQRAAWDAILEWLAR